MSIIEKDPQKHPGKSQNRDIGFEIISCSVSLIAGLFLIIMIGEIVMLIVGPVLLDIFFSKGAITFMGLAIIGGVVLVVGAVMLFFSKTALSRKSADRLNKMQ